MPNASSGSHVISGGDRWEDMLRLCSYWYNIAMRQKPYGSRVALIDTTMKFSGGGGDNCNSGLFR
jgi:hypothetical protein